MSRPARWTILGAALTASAVLAGRPGVRGDPAPTAVTLDGNLDARTGGMITGLLDELHRTHRLTSVYVTHNLHFAKRCDRVLKLESGALAPCSLEDGNAYV